MKKKKNSKIKAAMIRSLIKDSEIVKVENNNTNNIGNNNMEVKMSQLEGIPRLTVEEILKMDVVKLNLGSGDVAVEGYLNVDIQYYPNVDLIADISKLQETFPDRSVDAIVCRNTLQCFKYSEVRGVLRSWFRILKPRSKIILQCHDFEKLVQAYQGTRCECWSAETRTAVTDCPECQGTATMNDARFRALLFGSMRDGYKTYYNCLDEKYIVRLLESVGFKIVDVSHPDMYLKIVALRDE